MRRPRASAATHDTAPAEGSVRVWQALLAQQARLRSAAARLRTTRSADIHDARVAARRLRSLLATYRSLLDRRRARRLRRRLKDFAGELSEVRESDVRSGLLLELATPGPPLSAADKRRLRAMLRRSRAESRRALRVTIATWAWSASVAYLGDVATLAALRVRSDAGWSEVLELVDRPWRDAGELLARRPRSAASLHRLRLAFKRCRYALESAATLQPESAERALGRLRSAQDRLGEHHDATLARRWVKVNGERLGRTLARSLDHGLRRHEKSLKDGAIERAARVLPAYADWRRSTDDLRKPGTPNRGPV